MRKVELRMNEQEKYEVIKDLVDHNGNKNRASKKLGISRRQIDRLIIIYKEKGKAGFVHVLLPITLIDFAEYSMESPKNYLKTETSN